LLETEAGELRICKYVGFEVASWFVMDMQAADLRAAEMEPSAVSA
jgi:hypothetical protein